jgi:hypothetical protein
LKKAGHLSPSTPQIVHAQDEYLEEIKNDISTISRKLKSLQKTAVLIVDKGKSRFDRPTDFMSDLTIVLMDGGTSGISQGGTLSTLTFVATDASAENNVVGREILITSGTAKSSFSQATAFDTGTKVATVNPNFAVVPANLDKYMVIQSYYNLEQAPIFQADRVVDPTRLQRPTHYSPMGDDDNGEFIFNTAPDQEYGMRMRYYADLQKLDLTSTLLTTLYRRWRSVFVSGVRAKELELRDDDRADSANSTYRQLLNTLILRETYGTDLSSMQVGVVDYG